MTTKELTDIIVSDLFAEIPIENRNAHDTAEIEEEMSALIYDHVECYRSQMFDKITEEVARQLRKIENEHWLRHSLCEIILNRVKETMLNENKE